jgi:hypothetical protein
MYLLDNCYISFEMQFRETGVMPTDMQVWLAMRLAPPDLREPQPALPLFYGNTAEDFSSYSSTLQGFHPEVDDPAAVEVDETSMIVSGHGRQHGRYHILNAVILQPTTTLTRVKATITTDCPSVPPLPPRRTTTRVNVSSSHFHHLSDIHP